jgi:hypothetical protein
LSENTQHPEITGYSAAAKAYLIFGVKKILQSSLFTVKLE